MTGENDKYNYSKAVHIYPPFFDISCSAKNYKIAPALTEVVEHRLPEEELVCPECGSTMTEIGKEVRRRLKLEPAKVIVVEDWYYSYACRKREQEGIETPVVKAAGEPNFIPGSFAHRRRWRISRRRNL